MFESQDAQSKDCDYQAEIAEYTNLIEFDPKSYDLRLNRGCAYLRIGDYYKAIYDFHWANELNPRHENPMLYYMWGLANSFVKQYSMVGWYFKKAIELNLDSQYHAFCYYYWGMAEHKTYKSDAMDLLNKAIELKPDYIKAYVARASIRSRNKDYRSAIDDYNICLCLNPLMTLIECSI